MSDGIDSTVTFSCYHGGEIVVMAGKEMYVGGSHRFIEARPSQFFTEIQNQLPVSLYGQKISYKPPFDDIEDRRVLTNGDGSFKKMCDVAQWTKAIDIFVVADIERDENTAVDNERDETQMDDIERDENASVDRDENASVEHEFPEEARVERNVADFTDEEIDEYGTPVCSDDDQDHNKKHQYLTYKKGSGELKLEQAFPSLAAFKKAMLEYVLKYGWNVKYTRWDVDISELKCASIAEEGNEKCLWKIYCSYDKSREKWVVKTHVKNHTCMKTGHSKLLTQEIIAQLFVDDIRENPAYKPKDIVEEIHTRWNLIVSIDQCRNAKTRALEIIQEEHESQFRKLRNYRLELLRSNPGSTVELETYVGDDGVDVFDRFYVCFEALKKTWFSHCRPIFGLDGCFLKSTMKGQMLAAVGRDANNQMYPIAWAVVEVENEPNWTWFIEKLQTDLNLGDGVGLTVISDRQKGLLNAVAVLLPKVEHRMCARHIYANLKRKHPNRADMKSLFWKVVKSYNKADYNMKLEEVKAYDMDVFESMMMKNPTNCSLAYFTPASTCDDVSNNISESFNNAIDPTRVMPLVEMLETIRRRAMLRIEARRVKSMNHRGKFSINAMQRIEEEQLKIRHCKVFPARHDSFEVKEKKSAYIVKMVERNCTCRKWEMSGLPCRHALKVIADCYLTSTWRKQYETTIEGVRGSDFWAETDEPAIVPPPAQDQPSSSRGRKKIPKRIKERNESPTKKKTKVKHNSPTKVSRAKSIIHCGNCGDVGHNIRKCTKTGVPVYRRPKKIIQSDFGEGLSQQMQSQIIDES